MLALGLGTGAKHHAIGAFLERLEQIRNRRLAGARQAERFQPVGAEPGLKTLELASVMLLAQ